LALLEVRNITRRFGATSRATTASRSTGAIPGVTVKTTRVDRFPIEQVQLTRWSVNRRGDGRWVRFGPLQRTRG